jgi:phosphatidylglycerol:prolipoprotein diacylglycerol transferase
VNGITINIDPVAVQVGGFALRWYSLTFGLGILAAVLLTLREARRAGLDADAVGNVAIWAVAAGLVGARLFHVVDRLGYYLDNPMEIVMINHGGLAIWGGLFSGGLGALIAAKREGLPLARLADVTVPGLLVGQMIGRIGCIINGDAYGGATSLPWGFIYANPGAMIPERLAGIPTHPYPVYEILWDLVLLGGVLALRRRNLSGGLLFFLYLGGYAVGRFSLTFVRQEAIVLWGLQQAQLIALLAAAMSVGGAIFILSRKPNAAGAVGKHRQLRVTT